MAGDNANNGTLALSERLNYIVDVDGDILYKETGDRFASQADESRLFIRVVPVEYIVFSFSVEFCVTHCTPSPHTVLFISSLKNISAAMRWLRLLVGALGAVHALPQAVSKSASSPGSYNDTLANNSTAHRPSNGTNSTSSTLPESGGGSIAITDPVRLAYFQKKHAEVVKGFQEGRAMPLYHFLDLVDLSELSDGPDPVDKRQVLPIIAGFFVILELLTDIGDLTSALLQIANQIAALFMQSNIVWWSTTTRCRVHFQTQGGGNEDFYVINKGSNTHIFESKEK